MSDVIARLRAIEAAATPGPWWVTEDLDTDDDPAVGVATGGPPYCSMVVTTPGAASYDAGEPTDHEVDAGFIAVARNTYRSLLDVAEAALCECGGRGRIETPCPDPQCGDSTWDHDCGLGVRMCAHGRLRDAFTALKAAAGEAVRA